MIFEKTTKKSSYILYNIYIDFLCKITYNNTYKGGAIMGLHSEIRELINAMAYTVKEIYEIDTPISNIDSVVKKMGGEVLEDSSLDRFSDGRIKKISENSFEIRVSPFQSEERRNFTIAHELGHLFLHMGFQTDETQWRNQDNIAYYRNGNSNTEYQSNEFAAAFLMPEKDYKQIMDKYTENGRVNTSEIAKYFHVSIDAAANRGKWLGYLEW